MTKRIDYIDLAKGFCIILVVFYHLTQYYHLPMPLNNFFKAFRLPLYYFLSGLFFKEYGGFFDFLKRKTNKLLIPFVFWFLLLSFLLPNISRFFGIVLWKPFSPTIIGSLVDWIRKENFPNAPIWFLLSLFEVNMLFYCCITISKYIPHSQLNIILLSCLVGMFGIGLYLFGINLPIYLDSSMTALPFFMFGYVSNKYTDILLPQKWDKWLPVIIIIFFLIVYLIAPFYSLKFNSLNVHAILTMYPAGLLGTLGVIFIAKWLHYIPLIVYWGRYSIMILVSHCVIYKTWGGYLHG